jgi:predicted nucleic acid-binding protein
MDWITSKRHEPNGEGGGRVVKALLDTNILIDFLRGVPAAREEMNRYQDKAISIVSWMEVMAGTPAATERGTRAFLDGFGLIDLDAKVAERAVALRREHRLKLPDAIVWASAQVGAMLLVTRDTKGFPLGDPGVRMPYRI